MTGFLSLDEPFKGRHFDREVVVLCVRWYLRFKLSYRDLVEMMAERTATAGAHYDHAVGALLCSGVRTPLEPVRPTSRVIMACRRDLREDPWPVGVLVPGSGQRGSDRGFPPERQARCRRGQGVFPQGHQGPRVGSRDHYLGQLRGVASRRARDED